MAKEVRDLEAYFNQMNRPDLANKAGELAAESEAAGLLKITKPSSKLELPRGIRTETLKSEPLSKEAFAERFRQKGRHVSSYAQGLIDRFELTGKPQDLTLAWPSGRDLGLSKAVLFRRFLEAGQEKGYNLLHPEVGLYLLDSNIEHPLGDFYCVGMEPIVGLGRSPRVFVLEHLEGGLWLDADWAGPSDEWYPGRRLAFSVNK